MREGDVFDEQSFADDKRALQRVLTEVAEALDRPAPVRRDRARVGRADRPRADGELPRGRHANRRARGRADRDLGARAPSCLARYRLPDVVDDPLDGGAGREDLRDPERLQRLDVLTQPALGDVHRGVVRAVQYARTLAGPDASVRAVLIETDPAQTRRVEAKWSAWGFGVPLVVLNSPYRSLLRPLLDYIDHIQARGDQEMVTIVLPEFLPRKWWQHALHNQTALLIKGALLFRRNLIVADVPYLLPR